MNPLKKLAGQTAIYGLPSIVGRLLNYLLVPLHTKQFITAQYGTITEMYSYVAFLVVFLAFGMETAFFRYQSREGFDKSKVYGTIIRSLVVSTTLFILGALAFKQQIANWLHYPSHSEYVLWFAIIVALDAMGSIPLAKLRAENKAKQFAGINIVNILLNIGLNWFFIGYCMANYSPDGPNSWLIETFYNPTIGVGYVFIANLIASIVKFLLLGKVLLKIKGAFDASLLKTMFIYGSPLWIGSLAIIVNETFDKILLKWILLDENGEKEAMVKVGIYGACYKISIIINLFIQAYRYAAEPFFFSQEKEKNSKDIYAKTMTYFIIVCSVIFLGVMLFMDIIKHFLQNEDYWEGLGVVPILLLANICFGIFYNLSIWYKLTGKTQYGMYLSLFGAAITISLNLLWIPVMGYMGSAWATLCCYASMALVSWWLGRKHYKVNYDLKRIFLYLGLAFLIYRLEAIYGFDTPALKFSVNTLILLAFLALVYILERPKKVVN